MKILTLFITTILLDSLLVAESHHFKEVNYYGKTLKNVTLVIQEDSFNVWYKERLLKEGTYMIVSCRTREKFCLVDSSDRYGWMQEN